MSSRASWNTHLELSNNLSENSMRPLAPGANWIHIGSLEARPKIAGVPLWWKLAGLTPGT